MRVGSYDTETYNLRHFWVAVIFAYNCNICNFRSSECFPVKMIQFEIEHSSDAINFLSTSASNSHTLFDCLWVNFLTKYRRSPRLTSSHPMFRYVFCFVHHIRVSSFAVNCCCCTTSAYASHFPSAYLVRTQCFLGFPRVLATMWSFSACDGKIRFFNNSHRDEGSWGAPMPQA